MSSDNTSTQSGSTGDEVQSFGGVDEIQHLDSHNIDDDYMLRNENDPLTRAMTIGTLGFDDVEENDSMSTAEDVNEFGYDEQTLTKRTRSHAKGESEKDTSQMPALTKKETIFWSPHMKTERKKIFYHFLFINLIIIVFCFTALVIIWGSTYKTTKYYHKIKIIGLIQDDDVSIYNGTVVPMSASIPSIISELPGTWHMFNTSTFKAKYNVSTPEEMNKRMIKLIYDEKYWLGLNVVSNVTQSLYNSLATTTNSQPFNSTNFFQVIYESARDPIHVRGFMLPIMESLETAFKTYYSYNYIPSFLDNITISNYGNIGEAGLIAFNYIDHRPYYDRILFIVAQIACVFALVFTVFQFIAYSRLHGEVTKLVKRRHKVYYRIGLSLITHFISSLFWCTVHAVYQVDFTRAFGRGGFMVCWMSTWLFMWAVGGINENVLSIIFAVNPPYLGFWVLGFTIINISSTFFPLVLDNAFYRYGYFMPLHNFVDITRVIFFDLSKHHMGRNYGILVAWICINTALLPLNMRFVDWLVKRQQKKAQQQKK